MKSFINRCHRNYFLQLLVFGFIVLSCSKLPDAVKLDRQAVMEPDYTGITIPVNIAPLNFYIKEPGKDFKALISGGNGTQIIISSKNGAIEIPENKWKQLLKENQEKEITIAIYVKDSTGKWNVFEDARNYVSADSVTPYLVFRKIGANNILWYELGIYQRHLESYEESAIMTNQYTGRNCMNCHMFNSWDPKQMILHLRANPNGTLLSIDGNTRFIDTSTDSTMSAAVYPSWHPSGKFIAFSTNKIIQKLHADFDKYVTVEDKASDIILLDIEKSEIATIPELSTKRLENVPTWSPDGKYLYYISGTSYVGTDYTKNKYDLYRIAFDVHTRSWGKPDTILKASETGKSISFPRVSPDGKKILVCMADYGYFMVFNPSTDIYEIDIETRQYKKCSFSTDYIESYPTWSHTGKWIMFASKRYDNMFSRPWFYHVDAKPGFEKPFVLPQKDPHFYDSYLKNYNRPEFVMDKVILEERDLVELVHTKPEKMHFDNTVDISALSGANRMLEHDSSLYLNK